jgi:futalosine hydrolase
LELSGLEQVRAITVNEITTETKRIEWYKKNLSPAVESMEGAALHYVCLRENIPFLQIRSISNEIGERDKKKWGLSEAITTLNEKLILLLNELAQYNETYFRI